MIRYALRLEMSGHYVYRTKYGWIASTVGVVIFTLKVAAEAWSWTSVSEKYEVTRLEHYAGRWIDIGPEVDTTPEQTELF